MSDSVVKPCTVRELLFKQLSEPVNCFDCIKWRAVCGRFVVSDFDLISCCTALHQSVERSSE